MDKEAIAELLEDKHTTLLNWLENQDDDAWESGPDGKWTGRDERRHVTGTSARAPVTVHIEIHGGEPQETERQHRTPREQDKWLPEAVNRD